jgi:hypothetical protein
MLYRDTFGGAAVGQSRISYTFTAFILCVENLARNLGKMHFLMARKFPGPYIFFKERLFEMQETSAILHKSPGCEIPYLIGAQLIGVDWSASCKGRVQLYAMFNLTKKSSPLSSPRGPRPTGTRPPDLG